MIDKLRERFENGNDPLVDVSVSESGRNESSTDDVRFDMDSVASVLKLYLRELPETLITTEMIDATYPIAFAEALAEKPGSEKGISEKSGSESGADSNAGTPKSKSKTDVRETSPEKGTQPSDLLQIHPKEG